MSTEPDGPLVSRQRAIAIVEADAAAMCGSLDNLTLEIALRNGRWHVDYWLRKPRHAGGGPHYVIDARTGDIVSKVFHQ